MEQLALNIENVNTVILPDGTVLNVGDIVRYDVAMHMGITKVVLHEGNLCMENNFMYGKNASIARFISRDSYNRITKLSLADLYKLCKKNNWDTAKYMIEFGKR